MSDQPGYVAPAAWYVDPLTSQNLRWWSGLEWTDHVAPLPDVVPAPAVSDRVPAPAPAAEWTPVESAEATSAPGTLTPATRRAHRKSASAESTIAPPPPTPLIAPVTAFDWGHEVDKESPMVARVMERVDEYRFIPSRWGTVSVWLLAFTPWFALVYVITVFVLIGLGVADYLLYATLALPTLVTLALAQRDRKRLRAWGHKTDAHWAWSLLGALAYLIARSVILRTHTGVGSLPLWIWIVNLFAVAGACLLLLVPLGAFLAAQAY
ncbi:MAG TPA: DUF2510 domain-containing protein [Glaciibacter sp.]|nr:DUF2510 domain-containing protein [Glaciibacter sp.]